MSKGRTPPIHQCGTLFMVCNVVLQLTGCGRSPTFNVLGSYFPGWLLCMVLGVVITVLLHVLLKHLHWERKIPGLPLFYLSMSTLIACTLWLIAFE